MLFALQQAARRVGDKTLVFARSLAFLDLLETLFKKHGMHSRNWARLDGSMISAARDKSLEQFQREKHCFVLVVSLKVRSSSLKTVQKLLTQARFFQGGECWHQRYRSHARNSRRSILESCRRFAGNSRFKFISRRFSFVYVIFRVGNIPKLPLWSSEASLCLSTGGKWLDGAKDLPTAAE